MLVGATNSGKTTVFETLKHVMTTLKNKECPDKNFELVHTFIMNPKSITMGELYGEVNLFTQEW